VSNDQNRTYASDSPVTVGQYDALKRVPFSKGVARIILGRAAPSSIAIGIYGVWGEGKTTVLNFIAEELACHADGVVCVRFNPWHFSDIDTLLRSFLQTITDAIGAPAGRKEKLLKLMARYGSLVPPLSASVTDPSGSQAKVEIDAGSGVAKLGETLSYVELGKLKSKIERLLRKIGKRVVVLLDDIDRLDAKEVRVVFKLVKLVADFDYTTYVLAFDDSEVAAALDKGRPSRTGRGGRKFLEKIIQMPIPIPKADRNHIRRFCFQILNEVMADVGTELSDDEKRTFTDQFMALVPGLTTPRAAKRYAMALGFTLPILDGEVDRIDLMLLEGIRILHPRIYAAIRDHVWLFSHETQDYAEIISSHWQTKEAGERAEDLRRSLVDKALKHFDPRAKEAMGRLLSFLFPSAAVPNEAEASRQQRVHIRRYLRRYLALGVPLSDIGEGEFANLVQRAEVCEPMELSTAMRSMIEELGADGFLWDLRARVRDFSPAASKRMLLTISTDATSFPWRDDLITARRLAALATVELLAQIPSDARPDVAKDVLQGAATLAFAMECFLAIERSVAASEPNGLFSADEVEILGRHLCLLIANAARQRPIWAAYGDGGDAILILHIWAMRSPGGETNAHLKQRFAEDPRDAVDFLKCWLRVSYDDLYQNIATIVEPEAIHLALVALHGDQLNSVADAVHEGSSAEQRAVSRFVHAYLARVQQLSG
jgi:hypothetical protein